MAQVKLVLVAATVLALLAVALAVPARYRLDDGHVVSDSSSDSSDSSDSSSSESKEEHNRKRLPASNVPVSNPQQDQQEEYVGQGQPMGNAIPFDDQKESDVLPPYPKPVRRNKGDVVEQKMEPGQPWESHYRHGVAPAKLPAQETDNAHSYRHSIIHPYGADLHA